MDDCKYDEKACEAMHKSVDSRLVIFSWVFGIIITSQILLCTFTGYLATRVTNIEIFQAGIGAKLESIDRIQQQVLIKLDKNGDKLDILTNSWAEHKAGTKDIK